MASIAHNNLSNLSHSLLLETAEQRERFERNPLFSRVFSDSVEARVYRHVLSSLHGYYRIIEPLIRRRRAWLSAGLDQLHLDKTDWLQEDLDSLAVSPGPDAPLAHLPRIRHFAQAVGASYALEYIAWNTEVTEKHLRLALPRHCLDSLRFVTAYGRSRQAHWERFEAWLSELDWQQAKEDQAVEAANRCFQGLDHWLSESLERL